MRLKLNFVKAYLKRDVSSGLVAVLFVLLAGGLLAGTASAQTIPIRTIINGGFENYQINSDAITPVGGYTAVGSCSSGICERRYSNTQITTNPLLTTFGWRAAGPTFPGASAVEIWRNPTGANQIDAGNRYWVPHGGTQYAEIASNSTAEPIGQSLCVVAGETPTWSVWHRARTLNGANRTDTMRVRLYSPNSTLLYSSGILSADTTAWVNQTGTFSAATQSGAHLFNFEYLTGAAFDAGNFVDDIDIRLSPLFDLRGVVNAAGAAVTTATENGVTTVYLDIMVNGEIRTSNATVTLVRSGVALPGADFTVGTPTRGSLSVNAAGDIVLTLPPGTYDPNVLASAQPTGGGRIRIPLQVINDTIIENNEALTYATGTIVNAGSIAPLVSQISGNSAACGTAINVASVVIIDNDVDLQTTKTASTATPVVGTPFTYAVTFENNTAAPTLAPTTAHDVTAAIGDALPTGLTFGTWTCVASGGATCPAASGSGAISGNAVLPAGNGVAGGVVTYTLNATATGAPNCGVIPNISTIATPTGFTEGTSVQAGFVSPASGGTANNTFTVNVDPICPAVLSLQKALPGGRIISSDQFALNIAGAGGPAAVTTTGTGTTATGVATLAAATPGSVYTLSETAATTTTLTNYVTTYACTNARAGGQTPSGSGVSFDVTPVESDNLTCTLTNTPKLVNVTLRKTWVEAVANNAVTVAATGLTSLLSVANTANETDTGTAQTVVVGSVLTLSEVFTTGTATNYSTTLACTGTAGLAGSTLTVGNTDTDIVCTYTNRSILVALTITKTDSKSVATSGGTNNYIVTVSNAGPASADGSVLTDVVGSGLTCPAANPVTCTVIAAGAVCPSPITVGNLTGAGVTIATLPASGALQFTYTCNVN